MPEATTLHHPTVTAKNVSDIARYPRECKNDLAKQHPFRVILATVQIQLFAKVEVNDAPSNLESALFLRFMIA